jgi:hypothetical protein
MFLLKVNAYLQDHTLMTLNIIIWAISPMKIPNTDITHTYPLTQIMLGH